MMFPALGCRGCGRVFVLPYHSFLGSHEIEPYWPQDQGDLAWVCDACGHYTVFRLTEVRWLDSLPPASAEERGFWRVEIVCCESGCGLSVVAHTQTFGRTTRGRLGLMLARAEPVPRCPAGHPLQADTSFPSRLDFVEWNGPAEHLT